MAKALDIRNDEEYRPIQLVSSDDGIVDYDRGTLIKFTDNSSLVRALFTSDKNPDAPLHEIFSKAGIPYTLRGTEITVHPLRGQEIDANIIIQARKVQGVIDADQLVCK